MLRVSPNELFIPMIPGMSAALGTVLVLAYLLGRSERKPLLASGRTQETVGASLGSYRGGWRIGVAGRPSDSSGSGTDLELDYQEDNSDMASGLDPRRKPLGRN